MSDIHPSDIDPETGAPYPGYSSPALDPPYDLDDWQDADGDDDADDDADDDPDLDAAGEIIRDPTDGAYSHWRGQVISGGFDDLDGKP